MRMNSDKKTKHRLVRAAHNSLDGIRALWSREAAFRQEMYLCIILSPLIWLLSIPHLVKLILILLLLLLLAVEALNSALEAAIDRISFEIHEQSKIAKDMGSAAVLLVILMNIIAWVYSLYVAIAG